MEDFWQQVHALTTRLAARNVRFVFNLPSSTDASWMSCMAKESTLLRTSKRLMALSVGTSTPLCVRRVLALQRHEGTAHARRRATAMFKMHHTVERPQDWQHNLIGLFFTSSQRTCFTLPRAAAALSCPLCLLFLGIVPASIILSDWLVTQHWSQSLTMIVARVGASDQASSP